MKIAIRDYKVGTTFNTTCAKRMNTSKGGLQTAVYDSFGIDIEHAAFWGRKKKDVVSVKCTIIEEDVLMCKIYKIDSDYDIEQIDYFGYIDFSDELTISMIYPNIKLYFICFPFNPDGLRFWDSDIKDAYNQIKHRKGDRRAMTVRLKVEEI